MANQSDIQSEILFEETQNFRQTWVMVLIIGLILFLIVVVIYGGYEHYRDNTLSDPDFIIENLIILVITPPLAGFVLILKLIVKVDRDYLHIKFWPFLDKKNPIGEISSHEAVTYRPLFEYGGWGVRYSLKSKSWAYNVRGNRGVFFELTNGKKFLIGSQKPDQLAEAVGQAQGSNA